MEDEDLIFKKATELYDAGKYGQVIEYVIEKCPDLSKASSGVLEKMAWSYYRRDKFGLARNIATMGVKLGYKDLESIIVQIDVYFGKDIKVVQDVLSENENDPKICNAFIVAARGQKNPEQYISQALRYVQKFKNSDNISAIHMQNNMGCLYMATGDYEAALDCWRRAYERYGEGNFHHRAALQYWVHKAYLELITKDAALNAAKLSLDLWIEAVEADPENKTFQENLENAKKVYQDLLQL